MSRRSLFAFGVALLALGCSDAAITPAKTTQPTEEVTLRSRAGVLVQESRMQQLLGQVTREVAVALADEQIRRQVYTGLHESPYGEHKLHFLTFLRGPGAPLLAAIAAARGATPIPGVAPVEARTDAVLATLDSIADLEFYMPVKQHFAAWTGDANLIVASALKDNGSTPVGFDLTGRAVTLSASQPPATPTLVVVPVETDFSRVPAQSAPQRSDAAATADVGPGVYMTRAVVYSDHEGWPRGNPEFEVHLFQTDVDMDYLDQVCAGEAQDNLNYRWNTEETQDWTGDVALATEGRLLMSPNNQFQMWEDDSDACTTTAGRPPKANAFTRAEMANMASALLRATPQGGVIGLIQTLLNIIPVAYTWFDDGDDDVGIFELPGQCWPTAPGPVKFDIRSARSGHPINGWVILDYRGITQARDPWCGPSVFIDGPSSLSPGQEGTWTANPVNGFAPYTYQWYLNDAPAGTGQTFSTSAGGESFEVSVLLTDRDGKQASDRRPVFVTSCPPPEIICEE